MNRFADSIRNQIFSEIENILINNGTFDNSGKLCDYFVKKSSGYLVVV